MSFAAGSLVRARGREWVVLPESVDNLLLLRPLGGSDDEVAGIYVPLERVEPATFPLPDPTDLGDYRSSRLLRDAVRLSFRAGAGPFRSFGRIAVEPRPYQLVPLLMALKLDPVRLLIADDVGIGKTVEAALIARELLDRGEVERLAVLCPPALAEQWQSELSEKFHIDAERVLPGTAGRLERRCRVGQSLFEVYPHVIVSLDFIKSDRRADDFLRACPELVIVDEAHACAEGTGGRSRMQRHRLVSRLSERPDRHLILVTATPHSGKEEAFRSLLKLLDPGFTNLPEDLGGDHNRRHRERLAAHLVQRRRADIRRFLDADTPFPERRYTEETYALTPEYARLFERVLAYARETVADDSGAGRHRQRIRWWSALALLRSVASSPAAAAATLRSRAAVAETTSAEDADEVGRRTVMDLADDDALEGADVAPGSDAWGEADEDSRRQRHRLLEMAREAEALTGARDTKLTRAVEMTRRLLDDGFRPILFCRFIPTAEYLARELRDRLGRAYPDLAVAAVTGTLAPEEREARVLELAQAPRRVLVATDCLSEGVNLQEHFDAVLHYDLPWNPTRLEQREGRVDRFGQIRKEVRAVTYYGADNRIDGVVLEVLLRKHRSIRSALGVSVPVPVDSEELLGAMVEGLVLRGKGLSAAQLPLDLFGPQQADLFARWESASEREKRSRTLFAQEGIKVEEVAQELSAAQQAVGLGVDVARFTREALLAHGATVAGADTLRIDLTEAPRALRDVLGLADQTQARFTPPAEEGVLLLGRTHPVVEHLAGYVLDTALDRELTSAAHRCGVIRTRAVSRRTTVLITRMRFNLTQRGRGPDRVLLAEECAALAFAGAPDAAEWLDPETAEALLQARPDANVPPDQAAEFVRRMLAGMPALVPHLEAAARSRAQALLAAHTRVRQAARQTHVRHEVEPHLPVDVLGVYVYLPAPTA